jgi:hypothetical protein
MKNTGDLKSLRLLWTNLARTSYTAYVSEEDISTFERRVEHEGLTFLTVVLPTLGKAIDNYHSTMVWTSPPDFKLQKDMDFPIFLGKAVSRSLDGDSSAVDCVRQLSYMFYKLEADYDETTISQFLDRFVKTDLDLANAIDFEDVTTSKLVAEIRRIIGVVLCNEDPLDIRPCHGGGATACRTSNKDKYHLIRYFPKLDDVFSYSDYFFFSLTHLSDEYEKLEASQQSDPQARVCLVPKDSRGPRVISCEPAELMYIQQGLMKKLYKVLESSSVTAGQINFSDQTINRAKALEGSVTNQLATIDLADASDRVSLELIKRIFPPQWVRALEACRSEETILPDGRIVKLNKFAPMGSSCCFPVEALVFWASVVASIRISLNCSPRTFNLHTKEVFDYTSERKGWWDPEKSDVYVYGDDIIVPSLFYEEAIDGLQRVGLTVNLSKSFADGPFRESCGGDFYRGVDVTPVRVRKFIRHQGSGLATNADLANEFVAKFGLGNSLNLIDIIEETQEYPFPRTLMPRPVALVAAPCASNDVFFRRRWNKYLQRWEHRVLALTSSSSEEHPPNWGELLRKELSRDVAVSGKYTHPLAIMDSVLDPGYYTEPHSVCTKWVWTWLG